MKLLFIRETSSLYRYSNTSFGLGLIGTIAKDCGSVRILDNNSLYKYYSVKQILRQIDEYAPDVIGFNVHAFNIYKTQALVNAIGRTFPNIVLIGGGLHTYSEPGEVADLGVHIVARGEADKTITLLLRAIEPFIVKPKDSFKISKPLADVLAQVPGLLFEDAQGNDWIDTGPPEFIKDMDELPFVDYSLFNLNDFIRHKDDYNYVTNVIITQRGCPFQCPFCHMETDAQARTVRENSTLYKLKYVEYIRRNYDPGHIIFYDENFTMDKVGTIEFCQEAVTQNLHSDISFSCQTNVAVPFEDALLRAMKKANFNQVGLGIERLSTDALKLIKKNKSHGIIINNIDMLNRHDLSVLANCLIGFPFDTAETVQKEKVLFEEIIDKIDVFAINNLLPPPGTEIYSQTRFKQWYLDPDYINWNPSFYHAVYNFSNNAWDMNYFDLSDETQLAIKKMKEYYYDLTIKKIDNRIISFLHFFEKGFAALSYQIFRRSAIVENIIFFLPKLVREKLRSHFLAKFYSKK